MKRLYSIAMLIAILLLPLTPANASSTTARVLTVRVSAITTGIRVSVELASATTGCSYAGWYSYEYLNSAPGPGQIWTAILLAAQARGASVTVTGTASCDQYQIETINYIDSLE